MPIRATTKPTSSTFQYPTFIVTMANQTQQALLDPAIFASLTRDLEEDTRVSEGLFQAVRNLNQAVGAVQGQLSRVHSTPRSACALVP